VTDQTGGTQCFDVDLSSFFHSRFGGIGIDSPRGIDHRSTRIDHDGNPEGVDNLFLRRARFDGGVCVGE
jgi:hypothetical protein